MIQKISAPISVITTYNHRTRQTKPAKVKWDGREYQIEKIGLHHTYREGRTLYHVFSASAKDLFFKLILDTDTLHWRLEEIADREAS